MTDRAKYSADIDSDSTTAPTGRNGWIAILLLTVAALGGAYAFGVFDGLLGKGDLPQIADAAQMDQALQASGDRLVVVHFSSDSCVYCKQFKPVLSEAAEEFDRRAAFFEVNVGQAPELAGRYNVDRWPTLLMFRHGRLVDRQSGYMDYGELEQILNRTAPAAISRPPRLRPG
jgi:thiol-disulfide isomerase/thioredoxin